MNIENKKIKILLIEDHELTRIGLKVALQKHENIEVVGESGNGKEAIKLALEKNPNLIVMDIGLIEVDGIEATKKIKEQNPEIKIIMLTSHESEKEILASLAGGADGYCLKETPPEQLYTAILSVNDGNAWLSSQVAEKVLRNLVGKEQNQLNNYGIKFERKNEINIPNIPLSERELEVLKLIVDGHSNQEIAKKIFVSLATVKTHVRNILNKLSVDDRTQAAVKAMKEGLINF